MDLADLSVDTCLDLLRTVPVGRLVFTEDALPAVRPVNFVLRDRFIIMQGTVGSWADKLHNTLVAFEADQIDPKTHSGWSVIVLGKAHLAPDPIAQENITSRSWVPGRSGHFLILPIEKITGRSVALDPRCGDPAGPDV